MKLTWERTVIGGRTAPYDFAAVDDGKHVGRIYRHDTNQHARGSWVWAMNAYGPDFDRNSVNGSGLADTKADAVRLVEETYQRCRGLEEPPALS